MATLADIMGQGSPTTVSNDREDYLMYAEAVMLTGKQPLTMPEWVKAGRPKK
jgi:hypothetical protein